MHLTNSIESNQITLGKIQGPQGLKGWVKVYSYTRPAENIFTYGHWQLLSKVSEKVEIEQFAANGSKLSVKLAKVDDRNAAELLKNATIVVDQTQLEPLQSEEFYWHQLVGLKVVDSNEHLLGTVKELIETGANDVLVIEGEKGNALKAIPWVPDVIKKTDLEAGVISVDWQFDD
ncbi:MAG: 16S rRNA processing protein RimM [Saprospiraceae bacterium]|jgi:16S rRNA processing protein RimM